MALKFTYFPLWARGPSCALALEHSGLEWEGASPDLWKDLKQKTPWLTLPVLEIPGLGMIGHEAAILNYIGLLKPEMGGKDPAEFLVSQQLLSESEDIYQKLGKIKNKLIPEDAATKFWEDDDGTCHNREFGVKIYLSLLEKFYHKCEAGPGKFTSSGTTVGECKLFTLLHALVLIKNDVLKDFPGVSAFYEHFAALDKTMSVMENGAKMPGPFGKYF